MASEVATAPANTTRRRRGRPKKSRGADVVVCGCGVAGLQLTLAGQAAILASGTAFTVGVAPQVVEHLRAARVRVAETDGMIAAAPTPTDGYLAVIDTVLAAAATSPPAVLVVPGSPLIENSITRALVALCRERGLEIELHASVSPVDALINDIGIDVSGPGLQIFAAPSLLARGILPNPDVPLVVTSLVMLDGPKAGAVPLDTPTGLDALCERLARVYPEDHGITLVTELTGRGSLVHRTLPLREAAALWADVGSGSAFYVNPRPRRRPAGPPTPSNPYPPQKGDTDE